MLAKYGKRFHSGMNCNSGRGNIYVNKRGGGSWAQTRKSTETKITK